MLAGRQGVVSDFMRRLLVRRFESSVAAFQESLKMMIESFERIQAWIEKRDKVPVYKLSLIHISWLEAKNYNELSNAYSLAVSDISLIKKDPLEGQVSEDEVSEYVINSENAFSREHTQWLARKNN